MKLSEIIEKVDKCINNEVDFPLSTILTELSIPFPNIKSKEIDNKLNAYFIIKSSDIYLPEKNVIAYFYNDEFICVSEYGDFYWKDEKTYFEIKNILRNLHNENPEIKICDLNKEMSDSYKVNSIREISQVNNYGYIENRNFKVIYCYKGEDITEDFITVEFLDDNKKEHFYNKDLDKLNFYYNIQNND